ncbi:ABC transporter ATP-binding protein [Undibacterium sp. RTI2.1]|uniref:ABC transporter ATP-binding protein n=1 Tax=unclassified Undibacterium TaxID=2630295 RepID=UPI002AB35F7C|nr:MULTISPECIES: ABC transporter ATP-binding protein [unclassified Undibacterium]MDY7539942.1 ABC transporter ATP-binding protein [Undibacterium sp. 5I1]MEB0031147.1 ABC transporter ATP-binding protein [Undibacterium sp. RTI2.1]MEB0116453.1 ABC transporter ATP-binding protein [Undibacterium sp. RTI2.2]MEB0230549.1 ABC transporter ATP-binding protein [Undibacterium sp. 10I3]MEB0257247.1 ABC transporter ATP-binding protein [Undibacterium sp. 5I1]
MSSKLMISAKGIGKAYSLSGSPFSKFLDQLRLSKAESRFWALRALDLTITKGEVVGVIGQNGSGKSTLLQIICGTLTPSCGQIEVNGRLAALLELGAGFNPEFTGWENARLNAALYGLSLQEIENKLPAIEAFADIGEFIDKPVKTYSSGMFVRLAFAVIANIDADILIIDEALAVGDVFFTQKCMRFLKEFSEQGTILFVSHDSASVVSLCNRAILLEHGQVLANGDPKTVTEYYLKNQYEKRQDKVSNANDFLISKYQEAATNTLTASEHDFGVGGVIILSCILVNDENLPVLQINGETSVQLDICVEANRLIEHPLVGFSVKDRLGQVLFGGNSEQFNMKLPVIKAGQKLVTSFYFRIPGLTLGDYMISVAAGEGSARDHVMHHWVHEAYPFRSTLAVQSGMIEIYPDQGQFNLVEPK